MDDTVPVAVVSHDLLPVQEAAEPAMALFQPMGVVREIDPWMAGQLERLWGCEAFETYVESLTESPLRGRRLRRLPPELISALLALSEHHAAHRELGAEPGSIDVWLVDRVQLARAIAPILPKPRSKRRSPSAR